MHQHANQNGFSLIEVMIVVALFAILAVFAIPSYQQMIQNSMIKTATDSIVAGFQIARGEAVSRNTPVQLDFRVGSAWTVCLAPAVEGSSCPAGTNIQSREASDGSSGNITVVPSQAGPYIFNGFGVMTAPDGALTIAVDNTDAASDRALRVVIGGGGAVRSCDPALGATDPRHC